MAKFDLLVSFKEKVPSVGERRKMTKKIQKSSREPTGYANAGNWAPADGPIKTYRHQSSKKKKKSWKSIEQKERRGT